MIIYPQNLIFISKQFQMSTKVSGAMKQFTWGRGTRCPILNPRPFLSSFHLNGVSPSTRFEGSRGTTWVLSRTSIRLPSFRPCFSVRFIHSPTLTGPRLGKYYLVSFGCFSNMCWVWCWSSYWCLPKFGWIFRIFFAETPVSQKSGNASCSMARDHFLGIIWWSQDQKRTKVAKVQHVLG